MSAKDVLVVVKAVGTTDGSNRALEAVVDVAVEVVVMVLVLKFSSPSLEVSKPPKFKTSKFDFL